MADETRDFLLPDLGEGLTDAEIVQWLVKEGDTIELNQPLVEVETEKALVEIPSPFAGTVVKTFGEVGERVEVGKPLITFGVAEGAPTTGRKEVLVGYGPEEGGGKRRKSRRIGRRGDETPVEEEPPAPPAPRKALATPPVRKLAREMGVDIETVTGSGPDGRVMREDILAASGSAQQTGADETEQQPGTVVPLTPAQRLRAVPVEEEERIPIRGIRKRIAESMVRSVSTIPHVTEWLQVDATELMKLRADLQKTPEAEGMKLSPLPISIKALIAALRRHPIMNSTWDADANEIVVKRIYHVGIATDTERGLLVPVVRDADQLNVFELAREIGRVVEAARSGKATPAELSGSTITVSNIGSFGMESGTPIINFPECAILALGAIQQRPWVVEGEIVVRQVTTLALSFDHRIVDGAEAGRFLRYLGDLIEKPARLFGVL